MGRVSILFFALIFVKISLGQIVINEFLANNDTTVVDQNGESDDWIELYNNSDSTVNLRSFFLTDDRDLLTQWIFPDTTIDGHDFLIVWADNDGDQVGLHANFKLSASGEAIYLASPSLIVVDSITYCPQSVDISYGRYPDGSGVFQFMYPTFSAPNNPLEPPNLNPGEGLFGDTLIHRIELQFYIDNWKDSLRYNFEILDKQYLPARLIFNDSIVLDSIGVRYKGNSSYMLSRNTPKKPFEFDFNKYCDSRNLLGLHRLNVQNCVSDPSYMRETLAYHIARQYMPAPRTAYADLYIEGELIGFYVLVEQVDKIFLSRYFDNNGYNLYKVNDNGAGLLYRGEEQSLYETEYELKTNEEDNDWSHFIRLMEKLNTTPDEVFADTLAGYLNLDSCLRLLAFNMALSNFDSYTGSGRNYYFYDYQTTGQFHFIVWDLNESFGVYTNNWNVFNQDVLEISNLEMRPLNRRILKNDSLRHIYLDYIAEIIAGPASYDSISARIDLLRPLLEPHVSADQNKLYSTARFLTNLESDVFVDIGRRIPGLKRFAREHAENLYLQLNSARVYPGDTDNNGIVDVYDILPVGVYFLNSGTARSEATLTWQVQLASPWEIAAATYADANGDGVVDERDIVPIGVNWGNTHIGSTQIFDIMPDNYAWSINQRQVFRSLLNSLKGESEPVMAMKSLLQDILGVTEAIPLEFELEQNYPNPFNQETMIRFSLPEAGTVSLIVLNILGQAVDQPIAKKHYEAGRYFIALDVSNFTSGLYFYRIETERTIKVRKMMLLK